MIDHELRHEKDGSLEDSEMSLRWKIWCGGAWYMAKEQVDVCELEEPHCLSAASTPEKKECQGTKFCLIGRYSKMLKNARYSYLLFTTYSVTWERTLPYAEQCPIQNSQILALMYRRFFTSSVRIGIRPIIFGFLASA